MVSPPSSLPSPTPSSGSHHHTFSSIPPAGRPSRVPSSMSSGSGSQPRYLGPDTNDSFLSSHSPSYSDANFPQLTPQPPTHETLPPPPGPGSAAYGNTNPQVYLPQVTSSPPPHVPQYVPPPQHAMAPDPIHHQMNMMAGGAPGPGGHAPPPPPPWSRMPSSQAYRPIGPNGQGPPGLPPSSQADGSYSSRAGMPPVPPGVGLLQHAMMGNGHRPSSSEGNSERRRRRGGGAGGPGADREDERDGEEEVISTIFVVGFPDDMSEREFQNIFTFAPGFEAATLKFPSGSSRSREPAAALLAELTQLAASQQHLDDGSVAPLEEAIAALQMGGTASTSTSTTPSAAVSMTPSAPTGPMLGPGGSSSMPARRQTIGFARFKTRPDALAAREHLQGKKIDHLTGSTLKAEMAKKNLHTKRPASGEEIVGVLLRSGRLSGSLNVNQQAQVHAAAQAQQQALSAAAQNLASANQLGQVAGPPLGRTSFSAEQAWDAWRGPAGSADFSAGYGQAPFPQDPNRIMRSGSPPLSIQSPQHRPPTDSKALLALAEEADELEGGWSMGMLDRGGGITPVGMDLGQDSDAAPGGPVHDADAFRRPSFRQEMPDGPPGYPGQHRNSISSVISGGGGPGGIGPGGFGSMFPPVGVNFGSSPPGGSDRLSETGRGLGPGNPADQNPPINTLYVGNLPAISPPTLPPNFLEESLRSLFQRAPGFKRMSFRQKINGPMCFVEFEDIVFASQAIKELYGHSLNGLVKGGIRLSYSKNSLGQRGGNFPPGPNPQMYGGLAQTVAMAGMGSGPGLPPQNGPAASQQPMSTSPHGLGLSPGGPQKPLPSFERRTSEATATSPLSPTAQPFKVAPPPAINTAPAATSPRARYFGSQERSPIASHPIPTNGSAPAAGSSGGGFPSSQSSLSHGSASFSPVSSPIRTPQSFSWVSSSSIGAAGGPGAVGSFSGGLSGIGGGFDPFPGIIPPGSLNGAASAWGQSQLGAGAATTNQRDGA